MPCIAINRSLESQLFNKANELQEDISLKRFDQRVALLHLGAVRAQVGHLSINLHCNVQFNSTRLMKEETVWVENFFVGKHIVTVKVNRACSRESRRLF